MLINIWHANYEKRKPLPILSEFVLISDVMFSVKLLKSLQVILNFASNIDCEQSPSSPKFCHARAISSER